jgi:hypothetical protein
MVVQTQFQHINKKANSHLEDAQQLYEFKYSQLYSKNAILDDSLISKNYVLASLGK